jgi:hypothetical protein
MDAVAAQAPSPTWRSFPAQSPLRHCVDRHVCGRDRDIPVSLRPDRAQPRPPTGCSLRGHPKTHVGLAFPPDDRGLSMGYCAALSAAGPGQIVWSGIPSLRSGNGSHGGHHCSAITLAEPYVERLIGSIRRECPDHVIILNERHLRRVLSSSRFVSRYPIGPQFIFEQGQGPRRAVIPAICRSIDRSIEMTAGRTRSTT